MGSPGSSAGRVLWPGRAAVGREEVLPAPGEDLHAFFRLPENVSGAMSAGHQFFGGSLKTLRKLLADERAES